MEKILVLSILCAVVTAVTRFPEEAFDDNFVPFLKKMRCSQEHGNEMAEKIEAAKCGEHPTKVLVALHHGAADSIYPRAVWVKRCVGLCTHEGEHNNMGCYARETIIKQIPVRIYNVNTKKEMCSLYDLEEHIYCGCRAGPYEECSPPPMRPRPVTLL